MATTTTTLHFPYPTAPELFPGTPSAESNRRPSDVVPPKEACEHTTRASSFESEHSCSHQNLNKKSLPKQKSSKLASKGACQENENSSQQAPDAKDKQPSKKGAAESKSSCNRKQTIKKANCPKGGAKKHQSSYHHHQAGEDQAKYKTELCKNLKETGVCKFGSKCKFAHKEEEIRHKTHINLHYRSKRCSQFFEHGYCPYGSRCQYLHTEDSYTEIFNSYCEKLLVWTERNPQLDMTAIMRKTHPFVTGLEVFKDLQEEVV